MKRFISVVLALLLMVFGCAGGLAATTLKNCALVVDGQRLTLNSATGYIKKSGGAMMVPVETVLTAAGISYSYNAKTKVLSFTGPGEKKVELKTGAKTMKVDGKSGKLRMKTERKNGISTADVRFLSAIQYAFKNYANSKTLRNMGYKQGALAVAKKGSSLALPGSTNTNTNTSTDSNESILPEAARGEAKSATQIVTVQYLGKSKATLTYYEKGAEGKWAKQLSASAYVGKNGIGKTKEGDKRTPTGAFSLSTPFGIKKDPGAAMGNYLKVTKYHYWSGQNGPYYNKLVDIREVPSYKPSKADEHLLSYGSVYNYCLLIGYNPGGVSGKGSAIFLHCKGKNAYTGGCVAVSQSVMISLIKNLKSGSRIVIY